MTEEREGKLTRDGVEQLKNWMLARRELARVKVKLTAAEVNFSQSEMRLAKFILPDDAAEGEIIAVWFGDSLIQAWKRHEGGFEVKIRQAGKTLREIAF